MRADIRSSLRFIGALLLAAAGSAMLSACGPDKETDALRQENAALRREAENRNAIYGPASTPFADGAHAAAANSTGSSSATGTKPGSTGADAPLTQDEIENNLKLGLPVYPNAKLSRQPGAPDHSVLTSSGVNIVLLESTDKIEPIIAFYNEKMTASNEDISLPGVRKPPARVERLQDKMRVVTLSDVQPGGGMRSVTVHEDVGRTFIELINIAAKQQIPASVLPAGTSSPVTSPATTAGAASASTLGAKKAGSEPPVRPVGSPATGASTGQSQALPDDDPLKPPPLLPPGK